MSNAKTIQLSASDKHQFSAYVVEPDGEAKAGLVILQEVFGVTEHLKKVAEHFAEHGYRTVVPALFDRIERNSVIPYSDIAKGRALAEQCQPTKVLRDIQVAAEYIALDHKVSVIGFCWGGTFAYLSACELKVCSAVAYYGTRIKEHLNKKPRCPVEFHFGKQDSMITEEDQDKIASANPTQPIFVYEKAGHAFACNERPSYHEESACLAEERTLSFLHQTV